MPKISHIFAISAILLILLSGVVSTAEDVSACSQDETFASTLYFDEVQGEISVVSDAAEGHMIKPSNHRYGAEIGVIDADNTVLLAVYVIGSMVCVIILLFFFRFLIKNLFINGGTGIQTTDWEDIVFRGDEKESISDIVSPNSVDMDTISVSTTFHDRTFVLSVDGYICGQITDTVTKIDVPAGVHNIVITTNDIDAKVIYRGRINSKRHKCIAVEKGKIGFRVTVR